MRRAIFDEGGFLGITSRNSVNSDHGLARHGSNQTGLDTFSFLGWCSHPGPQKDCRYRRLTARGQEAYSFDISHVFRHFSARLFNFEHVPRNFFALDL